MLEKKCQLLFLLILASFTASYGQEPKKLPPATNEVLVIDNKETLDQANYAGETRLYDAYKKNRSAEARKIFLAQSKADQLRLEGLKKIISENKVTNIDDLLPLLAASLRERSVLAFDPRGDQFGSETSPRTILFNKYADFIVAFSGDPKKHGYNTLEMMEFDYPTKSFRLRQYTFDPSSKAHPDLSEVNPSACLSCHVRGGSSKSGPRANWATYRTWKGFFGSFDDGYSAFNDFGPSNAEQKKLAAKELTDVQSFLKGNAAHGRYAALPNLALRFDPEGGIAGTERKIRANSEFTSQVLLRAIEKIVGEIQRSDYYSVLKPLIAALMDDKCGFRDGKIQFDTLGLNAKGWPELAKYAENTPLYQTYLAREKEWIPAEAFDDSNSFAVKETVVAHMRNFVMLDALFGSNFTDEGHAPQNWSTGFSNTLEDWGKYGPLNTGGPHPYEHFRSIVLAHDSDFDALITNPQGHLDCEQLGKQINAGLENYRQQRSKEGKKIVDLLRKKPLPQNSERLRTSPDAPATHR